MGDVEGLAGVGRAAGVRWAGEGRQLKGPGKRGSPLVPLRDGAGGPRDLRVVEPQHPRVDPCPRQPWLHQGCPQPVMWGQKTTTCPRRREWVVTTPAVTTVNLERLWGSRRRPISLPVPQASVQPQEKGESQGQRGDVPPAEQEVGAQSHKSTRPSKKWSCSLSWSLLGWGSHTASDRPPGFSTCFPPGSPVNLLRRRSDPGRY